MRFIGVLLGFQRGFVEVLQDFVVSWNFAGLHGSFIRFHKIFLGGFVAAILDGKYRVL